jgi:hypothetical protein
VGLTVKRGGEKYFSRFDVFSSQMENSGWAVMGAFTGVTGANEWKKGRRPPASGALRHFHPHRGHQFLEAHQVQHPFEVVGQGRQAPLRPYFRQTFQQKVRVPKPALDPASPEATPRRVVPKGCSAKVFRNLNFSGCAFIRAAIASINPSFSSRVILRLLLFRVHCFFNAHPAQPFAW